MNMGQALDFLGNRGLWDFERKHVGLNDCKGT
jgi:hypothetical protein